jgi:hypothetical protein
MDIHSLVTVDMVLRWAEVAALTLSVVVVAGVLVFIATVLHITRGDLAPPRPPVAKHLPRGRTAARTIPGL